MKSFWRDWTFSASKENEFQTALADPTKAIISMAVVFLVYLPDTAAQVLQGQQHQQVHWTVFLSALPMSLLLFWSLVLTRWWGKASRYIAHMLCTVILVGTLARIPQFCTQVDFLTEEATKSFANVTVPADQLEIMLSTIRRSSQTTRAMVYFVQNVIQMVVLDGYLYCKPTLVVHLGVPIIFAVAALIFDAIPIFAAIPHAATFLATLWYNMSFTVALRKQFIAERRESEAVHHRLEADLKTAHASVESDSILNHHLKNIMAESKSLIDLFQQNPTANDYLDKAIERLDSGIKWCKNRLLMIKVLSSQYVPQCTPVDLEAFASDLALGRQFKDLTFPKACVSMDENLCAIMLENVIVNAFRHGKHQGPEVCLHITLTPSDDGASRIITFTVTNRADPTRPPITPEFFAQAMQGNNQQVPSRSRLSDGIGLTHIFRVAGILGMAASLTQEAVTVIFAAQMSVSLDPAASSGVRGATSQEQSAPHVFNQLSLNPCFCCIDDSKLARTILTANLKHHFADCRIEMFGETRNEVEEFTEAALAVADIAILDQNMDFGCEIVYGTTLVQGLLNAGFQGLLCIRSANATASDAAGYRLSGAHCVLDKAMAPKEMVAQISDAYVAHIASMSAPPHLRTSSSSSSSSLSSVYPLPLVPDQRPSSSNAQHVASTAPLANPLQSPVRGTLSLSPQTLQPSLNSPVQPSTNLCRPSPKHIEANITTEPHSNSVKVPYTASHLSPTGASSSSSNSQQVFETGSTDSAQARPAPFFIMRNSPRAPDPARAPDDVHPLTCMHPRYQEHGSAAEAELSLLEPTPPHTPAPSSAVNLPLGFFP